MMIAQDQREASIRPTRTLFTTQSACRNRCTGEKLSGVIAPAASMGVLFWRERPGHRSGGWSNYGERPEGYECEGYASGG
jgi:hypothetical protein